MATISTSDSFGLVIGLYDSSPKLLLDLFLVLSDTLTLSEAISGKYVLTVYDTSSLSDFIIGTYGLATNETITFFDSTNPLISYFSNLLDSESLSDTVVVNLQPFVASKIPYHHLYAGLNDLV